ncbi:MAG: DUF116 domain-containing protein [Thermoplasmatales archaeon]|nr:DUF116 domain-containing protein [Thermoplasmatales archaeon]
MSYNFTFDLSKLSQALFREIAEFSEKGKITERAGERARYLVKKFKVDKITGLPICDSITVIEDLIEANIKNGLHKTHFLKANKRVLFLPHCCRKYMDSRCKAIFDPETASYLCAHCSKDCQVHKAILLAKKQNYDVYVLPGSSCVKKIIQKNSYDGVIGVACTEEISLSTKILEKFNIAVQNIPLIKNGCSGTQFNFEFFKRVVSNR